MIAKEEDLYHLWEVFCRRGDRTSDLRLRGVYSGKLNRFSGPDFQGAEFELEGKIYRGDVEIHLRTGDWYAHCHHLDNHYDNVLLHLVLDEDDESYVHNSQMQKISTLGFRMFPSYSSPEHQHQLCENIQLERSDIEKCLKVMALERLKSLMLRIRKSAEQMSYDQVIYYHMMGLMGKPQNDLNFKHLASILPWECLMSIKNIHTMTETEWLALLAIKSGLIYRAHEFYPLKTFSHKIGAICATRTLDSRVWRLSGQRPYNKPAYHIKVLAHWICQFKGQSVYHALKSVLMERFAYSKMISALRQIFTPEIPAHFYDLAKSTQAYPVVNWGTAQITEFLGNVIIPFFYWEAGCQSQSNFQDYLQSLYFNLPSSMQYAMLKTFYHRLVPLDVKTDNFYINQGLITLKNNYCDKNSCYFCPLTREYKEIDKIC